MDIEEKEDGIGLTEATKFLEAEKTARKAYSSSKATRSDPKEKLAQQKKAAEQVNAMVNKSEKAYYQEDDNDSLSTLGGTLGTKTVAASSTMDVPMQVDTGPADNSNTSSFPAHGQTQVIVDDNSTASTLTFESLQKIERRLQENDDWKKEHLIWKANNDKMMKDILSFVFSGKVAADSRPTANSRHSTQTDGAASSSGGKDL